RERAGTDVRELDDRRLGAVGEIGIAIAELLREVERQPGGELRRTGNRVGVVGEARGGFDGCEQDALVVAAAFGFAPVERRAMANRDEDVLQRRPAWMVRVRIAGRDGLDAEGARELAQLPLPAAITAFVGPRQLADEPIAAERARW